MERKREGKLDIRAKSSFEHVNSRLRIHYCFEPRCLVRYTDGFDRETVFIFF